MRFLLLVLTLIGVVDYCYATNAEEKAYLAEVKQREGVISLKSGLMYKVIEHGVGHFHPTKTNNCYFHYSGTTLRHTPNATALLVGDWTNFDSSWDRKTPVNFKLNEVIKGLSEIIQHMVRGDKWEVYIPSKLGYGKAGKREVDKAVCEEAKLNPILPEGQKIQSDDVLIYQVRLMKLEEAVGMKLRATCNVKDRTRCDEYDEQVLDAWLDMPLETIEAEIEKLSKKKGEVLKQGEEGKNNAALKILKQLAKRKKKGEQLTIPAMEPIADTHIDLDALERPIQIEEKIDRGEGGEL